MSYIARPSFILRFAALLVSSLVALHVLDRGSPLSAQPNPAVVGQWSAVQNWPAVSVHAAMLPTGKVLFYPYTDEPRLWDPITAAFATAASVGFNPFCSGLTLLADGRLFIGGGHISNDVGLNDASVYDPISNTWTRQPDMNAGRWYPTTTTLADGSTLIISGNIDLNVGVNLLPQVWTNGSWRDLTTAQLGLPYYPMMMLAPNGKVFYAGPEQLTRFLDTSGTGTWTNSATSAGGYRTYGSAVMYEPGKILLVGGSDPPLKSAELIDLNQANPTWRPTGSMAIARRQLNATVLPDGTVLVTGGSSGGGFNNSDAPVYSAERWNPADGTFTTLASATRYRGYHSIALLLPDGRVLSSGGDGEPNGEVFSPPYLFKGARPTITSVPATLVYGQPFSIATPDAAAITAVTLVRLSTVTHSTNMNQRFLRLPFTTGSGVLNLTTPSPAATAPPGDYMLFVLNGNGVPSVASIVRVGLGNPPAAPSNLSATAVSSSRINLAWTDNASTELGVRIERSIDGTMFSELTTVGQNATSYADTVVNPSTKYWYRIRSYNVAGPSAYVGPATATTPASSGPPPPPVAAFAFNEGSGSTTADVSANHSNATISNPTWTTGKNGSALAFNGVNTAVSIPDTNGSLDVSTITVEAWLFKTGNTTEYSGIVGRQTGTSWGDSWVLFYDHASFNDAYRFCALDCVTGPSSVGDMNTWVHIAATEDGTTTRLYRNGVLVSSSSPHAGSIAPENTKVCIGSGANDATLACNSEFVSARIDDVRIYGRALSPSEIVIDMNTAVGAVADTTPPTVSLQQPAGGATVTGANVTLSATASDNIAVGGVQFRLDGVDLGSEDTASPYSMSWNSTTVPNGSHTLTAVARDSSGNATTSSGVAVTVSNVDTTAPVISGVHASEIFTTSATVTWTTNEPSDSQVEYGLTTAYGSTSTLNSNLVTSHAVSLNGLSPATIYNMRAKSRDASGNLATSGNATFTTPATPDTTPPTVSITAPADGASVSGVVSLSASAADNTAVAGVQFKQGASNVGAEDTTSPYSVSWNTTGLAAGSYTLTAVARDAAGNATTSSPVTVQVTSAGPPPPVAAYGFNEGSGASSSDASPNGNTAIISNPSWTTGKNGAALAFNGVNTAVSLADTNGSLDVAALTVEAWVYKTGATTEYSGIIGRQTGTSWADLWGLFLDSAQFADAYRFCALDCVTGPSSTPDMNTWVHVAATEDGTTTRLYRNGALVASSAPHSGSIPPDNTKVCIGSGANDASLACNSEFVNARIDDVRIYGRALSAAEIQADMNTGVASVPDTTAPAVSVQQPANGATVSGASVTVSATASDNVGVAGVQFRVDGTNLGAEDTTAPYSVTWNTTTAPNGPHNLTAVARDAAGNATTSSVVAVSVNNGDTTAPTVSITAPAGGASVQGTTVSVSASAADNVGVVGVQFKVDGTSFGSEDTTSPYSVSWDTSVVTNGSHSLTAVARDAAGNSTTSATVTVTVNNPDGVAPTVSMTAPSGGTTVSGTVTLSATASDNIGVAGVQFRVDGTSLGAEDTTVPYSVTWDTTTAANGPHNLTAVARDAAGNATTSSVVAVSVNNGDTTAPTVSITAPAGGASVQGTTVSVSASAADNVGVVGVQFKLDGTSLGSEDTTSPYSVSWDTSAVTNGSHSLTAVARDAAGNSTTSATVTVTVNNPDGVAPTVSMTAPSGGATVSGTVTLSATAADNIGVAGVQFRVDGTSFGAEDTTAPYSVTWNTTTAANGPHNLTAVARDAAGNATTSSVVAVSVNNVDTTAPTVSITAPAGGASVQGTTVSVSASAADNVGVVGVQFKVDGTSLGSEDTTSPYSVSWDTSAVTNGSHSLTAVARDAAGNSTTSATVTVTVNNPDSVAPTVSMTAPSDGSSVSGTVTLSATASDNIGVVGVQFKRGTTNIGAEDTTAPYSVSWNTTSLSNGSYTLTAVARDQAGNATSASVTVTVFNDTTAPTVSITSPSRRDSVANTTTVTADASDNVGVVGVRFQVDDVDIGAEDMTAPYSISWDTTSVSNGNHVLTAVARDAAGNTKTSGKVTVRVGNPSPDAEQALAGAPGRTIQVDGSAGMHDAPESSRAGTATGSVMTSRDADPAGGRQAESAAAHRQSPRTAPRAALSTAGS